MSSGRILSGISFVAIVAQKCRSTLRTSFATLSFRHEAPAAVGSTTWPHYPGRTLICATIGFGLMIAVGAGMLVSHLRYRALQTSDQELQRLALVLADQAERAIQAVELVQAGFIERLQSSGVATPEQFRQVMAGWTVHIDMRSHIHSLPQVAAIAATDADGNLLNYSRQWPIQPASVADRDYFKELKASPVMMRFFGEPAASRDTGVPSIFLAQKVVGRDGQFLGLIIAVVELVYFERLYESLSFTPDRTILMRRDDGKLLARYPPSDSRNGPQFARAERFQAMRRTGERSSLIHDISAVDGLERLVAYHLLQHYPLVIGNSVTLEGALAEWRKQASYLIGATLLLETVLLGLGLLIARQIRIQQNLADVRAIHLKSEADARLGAALRNMSQGLCMFDAGNRVLISNDQLMTLFGASTNTNIVGLHFNDLVDSAVALGKLTVAMGRQVKAQTMAQVASRMPVSYVRKLLDGRSIAICHIPLEGGGWLATYEDISERCQTEAQIAHMAHHDALTDLPNRILFQQRLQEAMARSLRGDAFALLCLDLDSFKTVNDTLGHPVGDMLLRKVTDRLRGQVRETDFIARLGGDEFAIIQTKVEQPTEAISLAERLIGLLSEPFDLDGNEAMIGVSIGIAFPPGDGTDANTVLKNADLALYRAKADGRGTFRLFEPAMDAAIHHRQVLVQELRHALVAGQFEMFYQPIMEAHAQRIHSFEALLRWRHPDRGLVAPSDFIPIAEEIGLIKPLGSWVLTSACADAMQWPEHIKVAVNLSPMQFVNGNLLQQVRHALAVSKLPAHRLELEVTETVLIQDTNATLALLKDLKSLGISIALDDFGTGFSSLSYLRKFPFDRVKIDKSFVDDVSRSGDAIAIVRAVTSLCRILGMETTAEGVETPAQLERLRASGCTNVQGYLFSRPVPLAELPALCGRLERTSMAA